MPSKPLTCLLTGFDAFGEHKANPSQSVVESFPDILKLSTGGPLSPRTKEIHISKLILPAQGRAGWKKLQKALDRLSASENTIVIMTGFAAKREHLCLERFALNCRDYRIADNSGDQPLDEPVDKNAPDLLRTSINLIGLNAALKKAGYVAEISNHAGTFVCNEIYFRCLNFAVDRSQIKAVLFLHLPEPSALVKSLKNSNLKKVAKLALAAKSTDEQLALVTEFIINVISSLISSKFK